MLASVIGVSACDDATTSNADTAATSVSSSAAPTDGPSTSGPPSEGPPTTAVDSVEGSGVYGDVVSRVIPLGLDTLDADEPPGPLFVDDGAGSLWVSHHRTHTVHRVDPETGEIIATIAIDPAPGSTAKTDPAPSGTATGGGSILADDDAVWVLDTDGFAWRIDPATDDIAARVDIPGLGADLGLARRDGFVWMYSEMGWMRIDEATNTVSGPYNTPIVFNFLTGAAASPDAVWLGGTAGAVRVNPDTGAVDTVVEVDPHGAGGSPVGVASDLVWGISPDGVWAIDPTTNEAVHWLDNPDDVDTLRADSSAITDDALWVVAGPSDRGASQPELRQQLVRFDLATGDVTVHDLMNAEFGFIMGLTVSDGAVWAADFARGNLLELDVDP